MPNQLEIEKFPQRNTPLEEFDAYPLWMFRTL